ncbi:xanthine dehydrogenase [Clostridium carboxidivorans P7]|uniref:Molybdopterin dehydrogenase FAD-binding n=1 Tax=Clostridium carboxidivorans P7 TaxID=536227 RepID=C6PWA2_9CLOT|nr:FAD binding domain-containing protein [Clostridium carboxidivorans]AKN29754.1 xanthine dehydrogenase [Clostridium carboxidivorans P7]EET86452.1 molybdopterin dehydrogenase FAD-binding [Clostridium carboxidivorans P7]EFG89302.1 FAD binding domain in molybdopterin dehydrogenase [Clostridium carboxidivorans P7]
MIPFDFEYYKPESINEAVTLFKELQSHGKEPKYYGGGTEIISMARVNNIYTGAVIDIKGIPECNMHTLQNDSLIIGSAVTLTSIAEQDFFPLLSLTVKRIADHTIQDKITLGGNLAGTIIYREAVLPLLLSNSEVVIAGSCGIKKVSIMDIFNERIQIDNGDLIVQIEVKRNFLDMPHLHVKRTKSDKIDYPLITLAALKDNDVIKVAFSGLFKYPFRSFEVENIINNKALNLNQRINNIISSISSNIYSDLNGSSEYRKFVLQSMLLETMEELEGGT